MGSSASEMEIWTVEEFNRFLKTVENSPDFHAAYMILFWTGLRVGELLALTIEDIDFENKTLRINKSLQRIGGEDVITEPKTPVEAAERLGHENVSTTLNVYSHVLPGRQQTIASELDKIYKKSKGEQSA